MDPQLVWFILFNPLLAAALIHLFARKSASTSTFISVASACFGLLAAAGIFASGGHGHEPAKIEVPWIDFGPALRVPIGLLVDDLSKAMLLVVTGIGALVHIYSTVYMAHDESKARYFGNLSLFMFSMLGIVLANNFVMMFIFWELVGVSSYLLIGHWFTKESAAAAANKAFLTNRIGDFGFMLGILMVWAWAGTVVFPEIGAKLATLSIHQTYLTAAVLLVFCGAVGKSAQVPLHVWLPDAMEGPTPVSALIHAATMVAAGVYMLARVFFLIELTPSGQTAIAVIGGITALLAALMATQQHDIKRILAYSTLSQLGYMVMAIGVAAPGAAMFHLFTHAFFKALLFLGAGAIIHALHHEQDIWRMGGLRKSMRLTFGTFAIGTLALTGCPFLAGFFSKDLILVAALQKNIGLFLLAVFTAFLTAFYMTRLFVVVFFGKPRTPEAEHGHDGPVKMTGPLVILAGLSVIAGYGFIANNVLGHDIHESLHKLHEAKGSVWAMILGTLAFVAGSAAGWVLYSGKEKDPILIPPFKNKFYFDELYAALIAGTQELLAKASAFADKWIIDGLLVRVSSGAAWGAGFVLRFLQFGNLQGYSFLFGAGVVALVYFMIFAR
jgi:NADH-quinone oxidoreductase subunit L